MPITHYQLFLGLPVEGALKEAVDELSSDVRAYFFDEKNPYLKFFSDQNIQYLGKYAGQTSDLAQLKLLETNILSILNKICPGVKTGGDQFQLLPVSKEDN